MMGATLPTGSKVASSPITKVSAEEYLALDRAAEFRSEFLEGEMIAKWRVDPTCTRYHGPEAC